MRGKRVGGEYVLVTGMVVDAVGSGMYVPFSLVFFQRVTGLPLALIGAVLTAAGLFGMAVLPIVGALVDRYGAHHARQAVYLLRAAGFAAYPLGASVPAFAAIAAVTVAGERAFPAIQQALIGEMAQGADRDRLIALGRSVRNGGMGAGGLAATLVISLAGDSGFLIAAWANAASFLIAALIATCLPASTRTRQHVGRPAASYRSVLRDRPFAILTAANFLIALGYAALTILLPVYAVTQMHLPASAAGPLFALNTALCAFGGVPVARLARRFRRRTRVAGAGAVLFAAAFLGNAALGTWPSLGAHALMLGLVAMLTLYTVGELIHSPSAGALSVAAAPTAARGRYLATYQLSWALSSTLAPSIFAALLTVDGRLPWLVLAACTLLGAAILIRLERHLPAHAVRTDRDPANQAPLTTTPAALTGSRPVPEASTEPTTVDVGLR